MVWETRPCALCGHFAGFANDSLGPLLGPVVDISTGDEHYVHRQCALWSPEVYQTDNGTLCRVMASIRRSRGIRCSLCGQKGASIGCRVESCPHSFHLACAGKKGCLFNVDSYVLACPVHKKLFKHEAKQNRESAAQAEVEADTITVREFRAAAARAPQNSKRPRHPADEHILAAQVASKRARIEAREIAEQSSDDEEHFRHKERRRLARDRAKLNPLILGRKSQAAAAQPPAEGTNIVQPAAVLLEGWDAVGGLSDVVKQLKEMVLLPLLYPDLFQRMGVTPPRGILFHGVPGSGKTMVARALAGACAQHSPKPVAFFARKGADCLGKFSGEAERTLRLLFEEAARLAPSIVFLDELDGLVPARATREGSSDQIYASVVATLLSLMDGVADRGAVVVIGATNRPEAIDPALRRPGRFDREVYFGLPPPADRVAILRVHTAKWADRPSEQVIDSIAAATDGFAGADLQALATAAVMTAVGRAAPNLVDSLVTDTRLQNCTGAVGAKPGVSEALKGVKVKLSDWRTALSQAPPPCSRRQGMSALAADSARPLPYHLVPLLLLALHRAILAVHDSCMSLTAPVATAATAVATPDGHRLEELEKRLREAGAVHGPPGSAAARLSQTRDADRALEEPAEPRFFNKRCRLLLCGDGEMGQERVASALLCLLEGCQLHVVSLPALMVAGRGDAVQGLVTVLREALQRSEPGKACVLFLPRLYAWALNVKPAGQDEEDSESSQRQQSPHFPASSAKKRRSPSGFYAPAASPFSGLKALEDRGHNHPAGFWSAKTPAATRSGAYTPRASALTAEKESSPFARTAEERATEALGTGEKPPQQPGEQWTDESPEAGGHPNSHRAGNTSQGAAAQGWADLVTPVRQPPEASGGPDFDAVILSEVWQVFEQLMKEVPPGQPVIVLATCHSQPKDLPAALTGFFSGAQAPQEAVASAESLPAVVVLGAPVPDAVQEALRRSAEWAAHSMAVSGIRRVKEAIPTQIKGTTTTSCGQPSQPPLPALPASSDPPNEHKVEEAVRKLKEGASIFAQVARAIQALGTKLVADPRTALVAGPEPLPKGRASKQPGEAKFLSLLQVAQRAKSGSLVLLAEFLQQVDAAVAAAKLAAQTAVGYSARAAAASALQDEVQAWAQLLGSRLQLSDARRSEALRAAEARVLEHSLALQQQAEQLASAPILQNSIQQLQQKSDGDVLGQHATSGTAEEAERHAAADDHSAQAASDEQPGIATVHTERQGTAEDARAGVQPMAFSLLSSSAVRQAVELLSSKLQKTLEAGFAQLHSGSVSAAVLADITASTISRGMSALGNPVSDNEAVANVVQEALAEKEGIDVEALCSALHQALRACLAASFALDITQTCQNL